MNRVGIKDIIFSSSATVYDAENLLPPFSENDKLKTINPYGTTKLTMEYILKDMTQHKGFNVIALRYFNPIGAHPSHQIGEDPKGIPTNLLPLLLKVANGELEKISVFGDNYETDDGTCIRDYIHVMDVADAHFAAAEFLHKRKTFTETSEIHSDQPLFEVVNIGTGYGKSVKEMISITNTVTDKNIPMEIVERRPGDAPISLANPLKAKKLFDWEAKRTIMQAVTDARAYFNEL